MQQWLRRTNIERYRKMLETETDPQRRRTVERLLEEEELKEEQEAPKRAPEGNK